MKYRFRDSIIMIIEKFSLFWANYVFQSFLAAMTIFGIFFFLSVKQAAIIASIGATAFIVFAMPKSVTAQHHRVIGGYIIGIVCGSLCSLIPQPVFLVSIMVYSLAVGAAIFVMVSLDFEHPPAAGTSLGLAISGASVNAIVVILACVIMMALAHHFLRRFLKDLT